LARVERSRRIAAPSSVLWDVLIDPHHLPRWWPETKRVENVRGDLPENRSWTQVLETKKGRGVRADYQALGAKPEHNYSYEQIIEGTPFERFVRSARTDIDLGARNGSTDVTIALERRLRGLSRLGSWMMRRAIGQTLDEALKGLAGIVEGSA
jgi:uncharacterized protein YndB with AHSA1/START domain